VNREFSILEVEMAFRVRIRRKEDSEVNKLFNYLKEQDLDYRWCKGCGFVRVESMTEAQKEYIKEMGFEFLGRVLPHTSKRKKGNNV
jgi:hypothetical protein